MSRHPPDLPMVCCSPCFVITTVTFPRVTDAMQAAEKAKAGEAAERARLQARLRLVGGDGGSPRSTTCGPTPS